MWERCLLVLAIVASICLASLALVPAGCGPYPAVHGPVSALRAQRAFRMLVFAVAAVLWLAAAWVLTRFVALGASIKAFDAGPEAADPSPLLCGLRC